VTWQRVATPAVLAGSIAVVLVAGAVWLAALAKPDDASRGQSGPTLTMATQMRWLAGAGPNGAVVLSISSEGWPVAHGWARDRGEVWTAASTCDVAAVRPPAATIVTQCPEERRRIQLVSGSGVMTSAADFDASTHVRALGILGNRAWFTLVEGDKGSMKCVDARGRLRSRISLGSVCDIVSASASGDCSRFALVAALPGAGLKHSLLWVDCRRDGRLRVIGRCGVNGSFVSLSADGSRAVVADGVEGAVVLKYGQGHGRRIATGFLSEGAVGSGRVLAVSRLVRNMQTMTNVTVTAVATGTRVWRMEAEGEWLVHADANLRCVALVDPSTHNCRVVDILSRNSQESWGDCADAWPVSDDLIVTLSVDGEVSWKKNPFAD